MGKKRIQIDSDEAENEQPPNKVSKYLMIIDKLHSQDEAYEALKTIAESDDNQEIIDLLSQGGTGKDLLNVVDNSVEKLKAAEISIVFNACEVFLIHVSTCLSKAETEEECTKWKKLGLELSREILEDHIG